MQDLDTVIVGAGAAGIMCAIEAGKRGKRVIILDHYKKPAEKIRISGGGFCNFTNLNTNESNYLSQNIHFFKSALKQYTAEDFLNLVKQYKIDFHEKKFGQLFCKKSSLEIIEMLLNECKNNNVEIKLNVEIQKIAKTSRGFQIFASNEKMNCNSLVIATGGLSIPKIGASNFGYKIAKQFNLPITSLFPALVPITFESELLIYCKSLSGISLDANVSFGFSNFKEGFLFTHKGISGPSILQISSYWKEGGDLRINLKPNIEIVSFLKKTKQTNPNKVLLNVLSEILPKRLVLSITEELNITDKLGELSNKEIIKIANRINNWSVKPSGTEGYKTAEVTLGGIDTSCLSSKTMEVKNLPGLYFIGEVVDVTGHLGGHNFQWAWSSGWVAGQYV